MVTFDPTVSETWHPVPDFPAYQISTHLRLMSSHSGPRHHHHKRPPRIIKIHKDDRGYRKLILWKDGKYHNLYLHHVVAELALGPRPAGLQVLHKDDDKANNWPSNLKYGTQTENADDCKRNGHFVTLHGEDRGNAKRTESEVRAMRRLHGYGIAASVIAECFGTVSSQVYSILRGERWGYLNETEEASA